MLVQDVSPSTECVIALDNYPEYEQIIKTYSGMIAKNIRPMPDISYDFKLILTTPYQDTNDPSGLERTVTDIVIVPFTQETFTTLNNNLGQTVTVTGEWTTGFAESEFLLVSTIN